MTAYNLTESTASDYHYVRSAAFTSATNTQYQFSATIKSSNRQALVSLEATDGSWGTLAYFDPVAGATFGSSTWGTGPAATVTGLTMTSQGGGLYLCQATFTAHAAVSQTLVVLLTKNRLLSATYAGDGVSSLEIDTISFTTGGINQVADLSTWTLHAVTRSQIGGGTGTVPVVSNVLVILLENSDYANIIGNTAMPYLNSVAQQYGLATQYFANTHPSIGNYFEATVGLIESNDDAFTGTVTDDNIVRRLITAGISWKCYAEDLPSIGYIGGDTAAYVKHHNPFAYLSDVLNTQAQKNNLVPFTQLATDAAAGTLPKLIWVVPNNLHNLHDGTPAQCDAWLQANIGPLLSGSADATFIFVFDESLTGQLVVGPTSPPANQVVCIVAGPHVKPNYQSGTQYQHQNVLKLCCDSLGIGSPNDAATAASMGEFFLAMTATTTVLSSSLNPSTVGQAVTLTATITPASATGTVTFKDGTTALGTGPVSGGRATFATSSLAAGSHSFTAVYGGSGTFTGSTSTALTQTVNAVNPNIATLNQAKALIDQVIVNLGG